MSAVFKIPSPIFKEVKAGQPIIAIARRLGNVSSSGYRRLLDAFRNEGIKPRKGQRPLDSRAYRKHFDNRMGLPGAWKNYLKGAERLTLSE